MHEFFEIRKGFHPRQCRDVPDSPRALIVRALGAFLFAGED
jgi:hypothetical protein